MSHALGDIVIFITCNEFFLCSIFISILNWSPNLLNIVDSVYTLFWDNKTETKSLIYSNFLYLCPYFSKTWLEYKSILLWDSTSEIDLNCIIIPINVNILL